ncbi:MAG: FMN-binding protein [Clostridia bacterium]|nr:FMN-binding protein [Clostridia bacterium]
MKRKLSDIQLLRFLVQLICFLFLPGLFADILGNIKYIIYQAVSGNFELAVMLTTILTFATVIIFGRILCGFMCAFGAMQDWFYYIGKRFLKIKYKINSQIDKMLKLIKYFVLALFVISAVWGLALPNNINPLNTFGNIFAFDYAALFSVGGLLLIIIVVGSMFVQRGFCRYICPLGALFCVISKFKAIKIYKPSHKCGECKYCTLQCPMGIELYNSDTVKSGECIGCMKCISACPRKNVKPKYMSVKANIFIVLFAVALLFAVNRFNIFGHISSYAPDMEIISVVNPQLQESDYIDGTYEGVGTGFRGDTKVQVVIYQGKITDIKAISTEDDNSFFEKAFSEISKNIKTEQNSQVDTVTGATYSSRGIRDAANDALSKAKK